MQSTSQLWRDLFASGAALQARAVIGGAVYTEISPPVIHRALMQERLSVGNVVSASLSLAVRGAGSIPRSAAVVIEARLSDGVTASEWLPQGTFYISRRARDPVTGRLALECYDALLKANAIWTPSAGEWPRTMAAVTAELAALLGVDLDSRTVIPTGAAFWMSQPAEGSTIRDALGIVAQAAGGSWIVTPQNRLRLVRLGEAGDRVDVAGAVGGIDVGPACTVTGVRSTVDGVVTLAGDDTGIVVDVTVAPMIAAELAEELVGLSWQPFRLAGAIYDPAAELGDGVNAGVGGEVASVICSEQAVLGPAFRGDIAAPDPGELTDEYPYIGGASRTLALARAAAAKAAGAAVDALDQQEIFDRLTDNGAAQGLVLYDGQLYINASYINAGVLNVGLINFRDYSPPYKVPNEFDPDSLLSGQTIEDGWIVNRDGSSDIGIIGCSDAVPIRGQTLEITVVTPNLVGMRGGWVNYTDEHGEEQEYIWDVDTPAYGAEDAEGNLNGATMDGEDYQYSFLYTVGRNENAFMLNVGGRKVRSISVSESYSKNFGLRYGNNIGLNYKGLQVGKFVVDRSGNVTFNGAARFNGDISSLLERVYPVGSIYMSVNSTDPGTLFGGTWQRLKDRFLLAAGDSYAAGAAGGEASHTLTAAESGVPAHAHGLNSHKHSVGAHSHGLNSHTHTYNKPNTPTGSTAITADQMPAHSHHLIAASNGRSGTTGLGTEDYLAAYATSDISDLPYSLRPGTTGSATQGKTANSGCGKGHTHTIGTTSTNTGTATGSTANSTAFDSGAATGNTANNTAANASSAHNNMPPYLAVYMWKRTA